MHIYFFINMDIFINVWQKTDYNFKHEGIEQDSRADNSSVSKN